MFQDFNLLDTLSLKDNILLPLVLSGMRFAQMRARLTPLARKLGIETLLENSPMKYPAARNSAWPSPAR